MGTYLGLALAAVALFVFTRLVLCAERYRRTPPGSELRALIALCRGDRGVARRLVELEKKRAPEISEETALRRALARIERDHGR